MLEIILQIISIIILTANFAYWAYIIANMRSDVLTLKFRLDLIEAQLSLIKPSQSVLETLNGHDRYTKV